MNAFQLLKKDHQKAAELMQKLMDQGEEAGDEQDQLFAELKDELEMHAEIEEQVFYPALEKPKETAPLIKEAKKEHGAVKKLLKKMEEMDTGTKEWTEALKKLHEDVEHHVQEEEKELFPQAEKVLSADALKELGKEMQDLKKQLSA